MSVVVTGIGMICALGADRQTVWKRLLNGSPAMGRITAFDADQFGLEDCVVAEVDNDLLQQRIADLKSRSIKVAAKNRFRSLVLSAAAECIEDAGLDQADPDQRQRAAVILGSMTGGAGETERTVVMTHSGRKPRISDNLGKRTIVAIQDVARAYNLGGPMFGVDSACASGAVALAQARRLIESGAAPWCLAGGAEASIVASNIKIAHALRIIANAPDGQPNAASRPFDSDRRGYVPAEGACFLLLESKESAQARKARIYAELVSVVEQTFTDHPTRISSAFAQRIMQSALDQAQISNHQVGWINAHATGTVQGDSIEASAIQALCNRTPIPCSAPKSITGHSLGASGAFEAAFSALSLNEQCIPPTINLDQPDPHCPVDCVTTCTPAAFEYVLTNSFGFGGGSCSIVFKRHAGIATAP